MASWIKRAERMSHFTRIKTQIVEKKYLTRALQDLNYTYEEGDVEIRGFGGNRTAVEIKIQTSNHGYDIGFRKSGDAYEVIADWYGIRDTNQTQFVQKVSQRYVYHATKEKLEEQGFSLVAEEVARWPRTSDAATNGLKGDRPKWNCKRSTSSSKKTARCA
jgi:xanthine dehydrogenase molybdopterin-binding subunit B